MNRVPGCIVTPYVIFPVHFSIFIGLISSYFGKIQDKDQEYYSQFSIIVCGLDSVEARRWMNAMILGMYLNISDW